MITSYVWSVIEKELQELLITEPLPQAQFTIAIRTKFACAKTA